MKGVKSTILNAAETADWQYASVLPVFSLAPGSRTVQYSCSIFLAVFILKRLQVAVRISIADCFSSPEIELTVFGLDCVL
jgi:hypothetical protein